MRIVFESNERSKKADWLSKRTDDSNKFKVFDKFSRWFNYLVDNIYLQFTKDHATSAYRYTNGDKLRSIRSQPLLFLI